MPVSGFQPLWDVSWHLLDMGGNAVTEMTKETLETEGKILPHNQVWGSLPGRTAIPVDSCCLPPSNHTHPAVFTEPPIHEAFQEPMKMFEPEKEILLAPKCKRLTANLKLTNVQRKLLNT